MCDFHRADPMPELNKVIKMLNSILILMLQDEVKNKVGTEPDLGVDQLPDIQTCYIFPLTSQANLQTVPNFQSPYGQDLLRPRILPQAIRVDIRQRHCQGCRDCEMVNSWSRYSLACRVEWGYLVTEGDYSVGGGDYGGGDYIWGKGGATGLWVGIGELSVAIYLMQLLG